MSQAVKRSSVSPFMAKVGSSTPRVAWLTALVPLKASAQTLEPATRYSSLYSFKGAPKAVPVMLMGPSIWAASRGASIDASGWAPAGVGVIVGVKVMVEVSDGVGLKLLVFVLEGLIEGLGVGLKTGVFVSVLPGGGGVGDALKVEVGVAVRVKVGLKASQSWPPTQSPMVQAGSCLGSNGPANKASASIPATVCRKGKIERIGANEERAKKLPPAA